VIPDEAVEAAARFLGDVIGTGANNWEWHTDGARELLETVAPHLMATPTYDDVFGAIYAATDKSGWAVSEVADAVMTLLKKDEA